MISMNGLIDKWFLGGILTVVVVFVTLVGPTGAHNGWVQPNRARLSLGEMVFLDLQLGNHSNNHMSYRLASKWDMKNSWLGVIEPGGKIYQLTSQIVDLGEDVAKTPPKGIKGHHTVRYFPKAEGTYVVWGVGDAIVAFGGPRFRSHRNAKTIVSVGKPGPGFDRAVAAEGMEIVPLVHPAALKAGDVLPVQVLLHGKPAPDMPVAMIARTSRNGTEVKTDAQGKAEFTISEYDYYLIRAKIEMGGPLHGPAKEGAPLNLKDRQAFEGTMVILVSPTR